MLCGEGGDCSQLSVCSIAAEHGEPEDYLSVIRLLVVAAEQISHGPDEARQFTEAGGVAGPVTVRRTEGQSGVESYWLVCAGCGGAGLLIYQVKSALRCRACK